jgi:hypothetical protein
MVDRKNMSRLSMNAFCSRGISVSTTRASTLSASRRESKRPAMNDGQVHTIGSLDTFLNCENRKAIAEENWEVAANRRRRGHLTRLQQNKQFVPRRMRKTRPVLSCHRPYSRGTAVGRQAARCASRGPGATRSCGLLPVAHGRNRLRKPIFGAIQTGACHEESYSRLR